MDSHGLKLIGRSFLRKTIQGDVFRLLLLILVECSASGRISISISGVHQTVVKGDLVGGLGGIG